jgi:hypothetical protein
VVLTQAELLVVVVEVIGVVLVEVMEVWGGAVDEAVDEVVDDGGSVLLLETGGS